VSRPNKQKRATGMRCNNKTAKGTSAATSQAIVPLCPRTVTLIRQLSTRVHQLNCRETNEHVIHSTYKYQAVPNVPRPSPTLPNDPEPKYVKICAHMLHYVRGGGEGGTPSRCNFSKRARGTGDSCPSAQSPVH
jgi:hypothetical protein